MGLLTRRNISAVYTREINQAVKASYSRLRCTLNDQGENQHHLGFNVLGLIPEAVLSVDGVSVTFLNNCRVRLSSINVQASLPVLGITADTVIWPKGETHRTLFDTVCGERTLRLIVDGRTIATCLLVGGVGRKVAYGEEWEQRKNFVLQVARWLELGLPIGEMQ